MAGSVREVFDNTIGTGEMVRIVYHGGSQPGSVRDVVPISTSVYDLRARDVATGIAKTFKLNKIEFPDDGGSLPTYDPDTLTEEMSGTIQDVMAEECSSFEALGWHVQLSNDALKLARYFKNGKPRKTPDVQLIYDEYIFEYHIELDGSEVEDRRKSKRPYRVTSCGFATARAFGKMSKAVALFRSEAAAHAPT